MAERKTKAKASDQAAADTETTTTGEKTGEKAGEKATLRTMSVAAETQAAPLSAPDPARKLGDPYSSTDFVAANAALRSEPGARHIRLFDDEGADIDPDDVFEFPPAESPSMLADVKRKTYQEFLYREARTPSTRLMYPAGARVPVWQALKVREALHAVAAEPPPEPHTSA